jgi:hypothetical protein
MHLIILHYYNVTWLNIPLWIYGKTWTLWSFFNMGNTFPKLHQINEITYNTSPNAYSWKDNHLVRCLPQGDIMVPTPHEQPGLIQKVYLELGHFGVKCIYSLFTPHYHCRGMYVQVWDVIVRCEQCDRVRTSFSFWQFMLSPLPIQGMFYRWSCDLVRKLP